MSTAEQPNFVTVENYLAAEEVAVIKCEYRDGWVRAMSGATIRHNSIAGNCFASMHSLLKGNPCKPFNSDTKVRIRHQDSKRFYYPDLQVVCDSNEPTDVYQDRPVLIIEVLSPSTRTYDMDEKMAAYLVIPSLQCYMVVEQHIPNAIVMRRTPDGFLRETYDGVDTKIQLPFIDCVLPMSDIYDGIEFTPMSARELHEEYEIG